MMINKLLVLLLIAASQSLLAQKTLIKIDISELTFESPLQLDELFIWKVNSLEKIESRDNKLEIEVDQLPDLIKIASLSGRKLVPHHAIWIDTTDLKLTGIFGTDSFRISPENAEQKHASELTYPKKFNSNESSLLETSKPYLVQLYYEKSFANLVELKQILKNQPDENNNFWATIRLNEYLDGISEVGYNSDQQRLIHVSGVDKNGDRKQVSLSENKYSLIDFTSTACPPCLKDIDELARLYSFNKDKVDFISMWNDTNQESWISVAKGQKDKIQWNSIRDESGAFFKVMNVTIFPTYMLFDQNGKMVKNWTGSSIKSIEKYLERLE